MGLAAAVLMAGCFNPEAPELTTAASGTTSEGSTSMPPLETSSGPGVTTVAVDDSTSTTATPGDTTTTSTPDDTTSTSTQGDTTDTTTTTDATTGEPVCGNGMVDDGEDCDDDNLDDTDACVACQNATCGDGVRWAGNEICDDGNGIDTDACTNACILGSVRVAGNANIHLMSALDALGEPYTLDGSEWPAVGSGGVLIIGHDGASVTAPNYQLHLDAGGHLLLVGGSGDPAYAAWAQAFIVNTGEGNWHQSSACASDWNAVGAHPMTALLPAAYEFMDQSLSYHMLHFTAAGQPADTELLGQNCEPGPNNYVLATRRYPSGGTFTYMALDIGPYSDAASGPNFVQPFLQGYLDYVRTPAP